MAAPSVTYFLHNPLTQLAIASDHDAIEGLRLRPVLVDRVSGAFDVLAPPELYSDTLHRQLWCPTAA